MRLITWNVARRVEALAAQAAALGERAPDVVALQEVTARTLPLWEAALPVLGLPAVACTLRDADPARAPAGRRRTGVLLAARALEPLPGLLPVPWPETALAARVDGIEVHTVHVPNAANGAIKPETLAAVRAGLAARTGPRVLCGDLNTPRREQPDGTVWSFARDSRGRLREERAGSGTRASWASSPGWPSSASPTPSARSTATRSGRRAGRSGGSPATAAAGGSTTSSPPGRSPSPPATTTSGASAA